MTPEQFVTWLKDRVSAHGGPPHAMAWAEIVEELGKVAVRPERSGYTPIFSEVRSQGVPGAAA